MMVGFFRIMGDTFLIWMGLFSPPLIGERMKLFSLMFFAFYVEVGGSSVAVVGSSRDKSCSSRLGGGALNMPAPRLI